MKSALCVAVVCAAMVVPVCAEDSPELFQAIRSGDIAYVKTHLTKASLELRDRRGATPLMQAAAFGNLATMKMLLDAGADVNGHNDFDATALLWAARDPEKAKLLIVRGANVNARSRQGRTPLMLACLLNGGSPTVALLLAKGADVNVQDGRGDTALGLAASIGEAASMRLLLAKGADPRVLDKRGETPLIMATKGKRAEAVRLLLEKGVDVNVANTSSNVVRNGPIAMIGMTALHRAAAFGPVEMVQDLIKAGAKVNAADSRGATPLIFAVTAESQSPEIVRTLLKAGADVNARDKSGETALDWAEKFTYPETIAELEKAGGERRVAFQAPVRPDSPRPEPAVALARSMALMEKSSAEFFRQGGCVGCHHQPLIARAQRPAKSAGAAIDLAASREQLSQMRGQWLASQEEFLQSLNPGGGPNRLAEGLLGLEAAGYAPDAITDSAIVDLAEAQAVDGSFPPGDEEPRPPITESQIAATARGVLAVKAYTIPARREEFAGRIARARVWLQKAQPLNADDAAMRLLGLVWASAPPSDVQQAVRALLAMQRTDGGWAGNPYLKSDAYATGEALSALAQAGKTADEKYRRGIRYLLDTQFSDGSWYVRSRSLKFQPYFESGFPFGHDQWISAAATAWAAQAIAYSIAPSTTRSSGPAPPQ